MNDTGQASGRPEAGTQARGWRFRAGSSRAWAIALGALTVLSFAV